MSATANISILGRRIPSGFPLSGLAAADKDKRIRYNELEKAAVLQNGVREVYFSSGNYSGAEMAEILVAALPDMARVWRKHNPPFIASVTKSGKVNLRLK